VAEAPGPTGAVVGFTQLLLSPTTFGKDGPDAAGDSDADPGALARPPPEAGPPLIWL